MERFERYAVLLKLVREMNKAGSWTGETHIQKSTYFLQEILRVPLGYEFILYKHGPFSFGLRQDLIAMRADEFLALRVKRAEYGPSYVPGNRASILGGPEEGTESQRRSIAFVASRIATRPVAELERLATALFVSRQQSGADEEALARRMHELKPHITVESGRQALRELEELMREAARA
ncbi:MAG: hypothetical protein AB1609_09415 [Bacillota bacterium]